jgi:hypothetical protein
MVSYIPSAKGERPCWFRVAGWLCYRPLVVKGPQATAVRVRCRGGPGRHSAQPAAALARTSQLTTTAIYANVVGPEERNIAARMWLDP